MSLLAQFPTSETKALFHPEWVTCKPNFMDFISVHFPLIIPFNISFTLRSMLISNSTSLSSTLSYLFLSHSPPAFSVKAERLCQILFQVHFLKACQFLLSQDLGIQMFLLLLEWWFKMMKDICEGYFRVKIFKQIVELF